MTSVSPYNTGTYSCQCPVGKARVFGDEPECVVSSQCSTGVLDLVSRKCWAYNWNSGSWYSASSQCQSLMGEGSHLATVVNVRDYSVGLELVQSHFGGSRGSALQYPGHWLGMFDGQWVDGASVVEDRIAWTNAIPRQSIGGFLAAGYRYALLYGGTATQNLDYLAVFSNGHDCEEGDTVRCAGLYYSSSIAGSVVQRKSICNRVVDAATGGAVEVLAWCGDCRFIRNAAGVLVRSGSCSGCGGALDLSNRALSGLSAGVFAGLAGVTSLDLTNNRLGTGTWTDANVFADMVQLERLDVSGNGIDGMAAGFQSGFFAGLGSLTHLRVTFTVWVQFVEGWNGWDTCPADTYGDGLLCTPCPEGMTATSPYNDGPYACTCPEGEARLYGAPAVSACVPTAECDGVLDPMAKKCWKGLPVEAGLSTAQGACEDWGGLLASVSNQRDYAIMSDLHHALLGELRTGYGLWVGMFLGEWLDGTSFSGDDSFWRNNDVDPGQKQFAQFHNYGPDPSHECHNSSEVDACVGLFWETGISLPAGVPVCSKTVNITFPVMIHDDCAGCTFWRSPDDVLFRNGSCDANCTTLDLSSKGIVALDEDVLGACGDIWRIDLADNLLAKLPTSVFARCSNLTHLQLAGNLISALPPGGFAALGRLKHLSLASNSIPLLQAHAFDGLEQLEHLDLSACGIARIEFEALSPLKKLEWLLLRFNLVSRMEPGTLEQLGSLVHLRMFGSPVECTSLFPNTLQTIDLPPRPICLPERCHAHWTNVSDTTPEGETVVVQTTIIAAETMMVMMRKDVLPALDGVHRALGLYVDDIDNPEDRCWCTFRRNCFPKLDVPCVGWCGECPPGYGTFDNGTTCWPSLECDAWVGGAAPECRCAAGSQHPNTEVMVRAGVQRDVQAYIRIFGFASSWYYNPPYYSQVEFHPGYIVMPWQTHLSWWVGARDENEDMEVRVRLRMETVTSKETSIVFLRSGHSTAFAVHLDRGYPPRFWLSHGTVHVPFGSSEGLLAPWTWHDVIVRRKALQVSVHLDGREVISGVTAPFEYARVGVGSRSTTVHVDSLEVEVGELWDGRTCEDVDECAGATHGCPTTNNRACVNTQGSFECGCVPGHVLSSDGETCVPLQCGVNDNCDDNAVCALGGGSFTCTCNAGYTDYSGGEGTQCEAELCATGQHNCHAEASCAETGGGSFTCSCNAGYTSPPVTESQVLACSSALTSAPWCSLSVAVEAWMQNPRITIDVEMTDFASSVEIISQVLVGSGAVEGIALLDNLQSSGSDYRCGEFVTIARDVPLPPGASVPIQIETSTGVNCCPCSGSYLNANVILTYDVASSGDGVDCVNVNECLDAGNACHSEAACLDSEGSYSCTCNTGYIGDGYYACIDFDYCTSNPCHTHAACTDFPPPSTAGSCACNAGYQGNGWSTCSEIDFCASNACHLHATCADDAPPSESGTCTCNAGYQGNGVSCVEVDYCSSSPCDSNAVCVDEQPPSSGGTCACNSGWVGDGFSCAQASGGSGGGDDGVCGAGSHLVTSCPEADGFEVTQYGGHCYLKLSGTSDYKTAEQDCKAAHPNAYVAVPNSVEEKDLIWGMHSTQTWVGLRRLDETLPVNQISSFQFVDSLEFVPDDFPTLVGAGISLSGPEIETCVRMVSQYWWLDRFCHASFARVCELALGECAPDSGGGGGSVGVAAGCAAAGLSSLGAALYYYKRSRAKAEARAEESAKSSQRELRVLRVRLVGIRNGRVEAEIDLPSGSRFIFGRDADPPCTLAHDSCSRQHATLELRASAVDTDPQLFITDLGSANGTTVDGVALAAREETRLHNGQRVQFGALGVSFLVTGLPCDVPRPSASLISDSDARLLREDSTAEADGAGAEVSQAASAVLLGDICFPERVTVERRQSGQMEGRRLSVTSNEDEAAVRQLMPRE